MILGRAGDGAGLLAEDPEISRRHARLIREAGGALVIEDLGSRNGTFVNGERITSPRLVRSGDQITLGDTRLEVRADDGRASPRPASRELDLAQDDEETKDASAVGPPAEQVGSPSSLGKLPPAPVSAVGQLLHEGARVPIPGSGLSIGRNPDNQLTLEDPTVSRHHARVLIAEGRHYVTDVGSTAGTYLNGERLHRESRWLSPGDTIRVGDQQLRFVTGQLTTLDRMPEAPGERVQAIQLRGPRLTLGRDPGNDVVLDDPNVSRFHAEVVSENGRVEVRDLRSRNGTRVDGEHVGRQIIRAGSEIGIGPFRLVFDGEAFVQRDERGALRIVAENLTVRVRDKTILDRVTLTIDPGELFVVIGASGSGKSTLVKTAVALLPPSDGTIRINGDPVAARVSDVGYVPQDEIVHGRLTPREALSYSAKLRLPRDSSRADIDGRVSEVIHEVALDRHAETRIGSLSGGQRKRAGVAAELLTRPGLLFLDEPTTGLDPGLETRLMELFRELAEVGTRAVVVVTHATRNLRLADRVCVMGEGGIVTFVGTPDDALRFFGVTEFDEIYDALASRPAADWRVQFEAARHDPGRADAAADTAPAGPSRRLHALPQAAVLIRRYLKLMWRDRRNLAILLGQVPVLAVFSALIFKPGVLQAPPSNTTPASAAQIVFVLITVATWIGSIDAAREIVKERALARHEAAAGVRPSAYLLSKVVVLFSLVTVQLALLLAIVFAMRTPEHPTLQTYLEVGTLLGLTGVVSVGQGLLISALVQTEDRATSFIPLALIPQLLFGGAIVPILAMSGVIEALSNVVFSRWSLAGIGSALKLDTFGFQITGRYGRDFFAFPFETAVIVLAAFLVCFLAIVYFRLRTLHSPRGAKA